MGSSATDEIEAVPAVMAAASRRSARERDFSKELAAAFFSFLLLGFSLTYEEPSLDIDLSNSNNMIKLLSILQIFAE